MTKEITTKLVEQTTVKYIACDGKVFEGERAQCECEAYERRLDVEKCEREFKKLNPRYIPEPGIDWVSSETEMWAVPIKSEADWLTLLDYVKTRSCYMDITGLEDRKPVAFPVDVLAVIEYEYASRICGIDDFVKQLEKSIKAIKGE